MRDAAVVFAIALSMLGVAVVTLPGAIASSPDSEENPYPDVNPCASGVSEVSGTIKVCTLIKVAGSVEVMTHPLRAMVWIQISTTGPTAHVSDTLNGIAWVQDTEGIGLTQRDDWHVAIQSWNLPPDVELLPPVGYLNVKVNEARTFVFNCLGERCDRLAPSPTPSITSRPPNATREPSITPTAPISGTATATAPVTPTNTMTTTPTPTGPVTPTVAVTTTTTPTGTALPTATVTATITATTTATASATSTMTVTAHTTPSATSTATPTFPAGSPVTGSVKLEVIDVPNGCTGIRFRGAFTATSAAAPVDEMRSVVYHSRLACSYAMAHLDDAPWQAFEPTRVYTGNGGAHVFASFLAVQYRDGEGNVSERMCDRAEGICAGTSTPPPPTPKVVFRSYLPALVR